MSLVQRFERRLESLVDGTFARVFKGQVEPVEIASALQREAADKRNVMGGDQVLSPNRYRVTLAPSDFERLSPWEQQLTNSLAEMVQEYLDDNRWDTIGDIEVYLARDDDLHTGVFGVASRMEAAAPPRRRPHDSLSLPIVPGLPLGEYPVQQQGEQAPPARERDAAAGVPAPTSRPSPYPAAPDVLAEPFQPIPQFQPPQFQPPQFQPPQFQPPQFQPPQYQPAQFQPPQFQPAQFQPPQYAGRQQAPQHAPSQRRSAAAVLIVDQSNRRFDLRHGNNIVGRGTDSDLQLLDHGVSRRHLDVQYDGQVATASDLGSTNGTTVNGHEISSQQLRHGDVIRVGHTRIVFQQERV